MRLASFDCFDTVVTRAVSGPQALFLLLGERVDLPVSAEVFARVRVAAGAAVETRWGARHTLADIYAEVRWRLALDRDPEALAEAEMQLERELSRPVPGVSERLDRVAHAGQDRIFLSDTPLSAEFVSSLLDAHHLRRGAPVLVSNELGASKEIGSVYRVVARRCGVRTRDWEHHGDNLRADVHNARRAGLRAQYLRQAHLTRYERVLDGHTWATGGAAALLAGASRLARTRPPEDDPKQDVAAGVIAPLLCAYVLWCLEQAKAAGIGRLYFLARDGQLLLRIAEVLGAHVARDVQVAYLYGSREAWLLEDDDPLRRELSHARRGAGDATLRAASTYLASAGVLDGSPYAIVDMASRGNVGRLFGELASAAGGRPPALELYFAKDGSEDLAKDDAAGRVVRGWLYDDSAGHGHHVTVQDAYVALEMFTTADHGKVVGYGGDGVPVMEPLSPEVRSWDFAPVSKTVLRFAEQLTTVLAFLPRGIDLRQATWSPFELFWAEPSEAEISTWGAFPFEADDGSTRPAATSLSLGRLLKGVLQRSPAVRPRGSWPVAAHRGMAPPLRWAHATARRGRTHVPRLKRLLVMLAARAERPPR